MAKISNTVAYPNIQPKLDDYFVLSDKNDSLLTKSTQLSDVKSLFGIETVTAHISVQDVELQNLQNTDVTLITAPGINKVLDILSMDVFMDVGSIQYNFINDSIVKMNNVNITTIPASTINSTTDLIVKQTIGTGVLAKNSPLLLTNIGNPTQGNGILRINIFYRELTVDNLF
jgi:hypothetical protein|tara:strand:+ start:315 stop:833 length:519 start_codon:yes stop_codon:yes gene_type:complete